MCSGHILYQQNNGLLYVSANFDVVSWCDCKLSVRSCLVRSHYVSHYHLMLHPIVMLCISLCGFEKPFKNYLFSCNRSLNYLLQYLNLKECLYIEWSKIPGSSFLPSQGHIMQDLIVVSTVLRL